MKTPRNALVTSVLWRRQRLRRSRYLQPMSNRKDQSGPAPAKDSHAPTHKCRIMPNRYKSFNLFFYEQERKDTRKDSEVVRRKWMQIIKISKDYSNHFLERPKKNKQRKNIKNIATIPLSSTLSRLGKQSTLQFAWITEDQVLDILLFLLPFFSPLPPIILKCTALTDS